MQQIKANSQQLGIYDMLAAIFYYIIILFLLTIKLGNLL